MAMEISRLLWPPAIRRSAIGAIAITRLTHRYRIRSSGGWTMQRAAIHSDLAR